MLNDLLIFRISRNQKNTNFLEEKCHHPVKLHVSIGFTKKFENQSKSRVVRFARVLQCYFYSSGLQKARKGTKQRIIVNNSVF